jgi:hypothetical protein
MMVPSVLPLSWLPGTKYSHDRRSLRCYCMILTSRPGLSKRSVAYGLSVLCGPGGMMDGRWMLKTCQIDYDVHASFLMSYLGTRRPQRTSPTVQMKYSNLRDSDSSCTAQPIHASSRILAAHAQIIPIH